jgi:hypothetical protein
MANVVEYPPPKATWGKYKVFEKSETGKNATNNMSNAILRVIPSTPG